jgi:hypothetical protein
MILQLQTKTFLVSEFTFPRGQSDLFCERQVPVVCELIMIYWR